MIFTEDIRPKAFKVLEYRNLRRQHSYLADVTTLGIKHLPNVRLTGSLVRNLNSIATCGLCENPGRYRTEPVSINKSLHTPPEPSDISRHMGDLCVFVNENWNLHSPCDLSAYVLWRLVWIHPFEDGNGRTADAAAYYTLCRKYEKWLPGKKIIPTYWHANRDNRYYEALAAADSYGKNTPKAVSELSTLMKSALLNQIKSI